MESRALLEEAFRRWGPPGPEWAAARAELRRSRFDKQLRFIDDPARKKAAFCSRRAGKTDNVATDLLDSAISAPGTLQIYCAIARTRAKELVWEQFKSTAQKVGIDARPNETELTMRLAIGQGSVIRLTGADKINEAHKKRGDKARRVRIDEAQVFPFHILKALTEDVFGPTLEDLGGDLGLLGTPGEVCAGFWHGITRPEVAKRTPGWSVHLWGALDNPHVPLIHARMRSGDLARDCGGAESATYQREWLGRWVRDVGSLFYAYDEDRNSHDFDEDELFGEEWYHSLGWDIGASGNMALVAWAFNPQRTRDVYEAFSWVGGGSIDDVMDQVKWLKTRCRFVSKVGDAGGLGKLIIAEAGTRRKENFEAAEKSEKASHVRLFNDELLAGHVKLRRNSPYASEIAVLPKLVDWDPAEHDGKPAPEDPRFPNHACDAGLYSWRSTRGYMHEPAEERPAPGTPAAVRLEVQERKLARQRQLQAKQNRAWWEKR